MPWPSMAQTCGSAGGVSTATDCDTTYRDLKITCAMSGSTAVQTWGTQAPCPKTPMPMKITGAAPQSLIKDFTPYLFAYARDPDDSSRPYGGEWARGTVGDNIQTFQLVGNATKVTSTGASATRQDTCVNQISMDGLSAADQAKAVRLQIDNCTNQYILHASLGPEYRKNPTLLDGENPSDASELISLKTHCQPLRTQYDGKPEYKVSDYLQVAWQKTLINPSATKAHAAFLPSVSVPNIPLLKQLIQLVMKLLSQLFPALNNNSEPHLPSGVTLQNTSDPAIVPPPTFPDVTLAQLGGPQEGSGNNYEMIVDPTHPFSPRWDFFYNDRDISKMVSSYETDTKNSVYCAGNRGDSTTDSKDNKVYKVDVLEFRRPEFEQGMIVNRIGFNAACFADTVPFSADIATVAATSYCFQATSPFTATHIPCWQCFGNKMGVKVDDKTTKPPCATRYDSEDQKIVAGYIPGALNKFSRQAHCTLNPADSVASASTLCKDLRRPVTVMNVLKMRYHNPGATDTDKQNDANYAKNDELPGGAPEGYSFNEYFKPSGENNGHMPYPRLWDTGRSIQKGTSTDQDPMDVLGQYTTIVGAGREGVAQSQQSGSSTTQQKGERCMYGGWGAAATFGGVSVKAPDPITSWTELKLYQARTMRESNLVCLGRYEKVFKPRSSEGQLLMRASGEYTGVQICSSSASGSGSGSTITCRDYADDSTAPANAENARHVHHSWPPAWRGYLSDPTASQQFPAFGGNASTGVHTGLDDVRCGDVIMMPKGGGDTSAATTGTGTTATSMLGLPKLARVVGLNTPNHTSCNFKNNTTNTPSDCAAKNNCYVDVEEADAGKWPDACGTTEVAGGLQTRRLYKKGMFPSSGTTALNALNNWTHGCEDPGLNACELATWDTLQYYRPSEDVRQGN